eukprot:1753831-Rhodomonas_salina.1
MECLKGVQMQLLESGNARGNAIAWLRASKTPTYGTGQQCNVITVIDDRTEGERTASLDVASRPLKKGDDLSVRGWRIAAVTSDGKSRKESSSDSSSYRHRALHLRRVVAASLGNRSEFSGAGRGVWGNRARGEDKGRRGRIEVLFPTKRDQNAPCHTSNATTSKQTEINALNRASGLMLKLELRGCGSASPESAKKSSNISTLASDGPTLKFIVTLTSGGPVRPDSFEATKVSSRGKLSGSRNSCSSNSTDAWSKAATPSSVQSISPGARNASRRRGLTPPALSNAETATG